jgi:hypothetical protein
VSAQQAAASSKCEPQQAEIMALQLAAWMRVRVGTSGFICKLLEKLFARSTLHGVFHAVFDAGKFARFTLYRTCSACMCSRAFSSMRARPCAADSAEAALIVVSDFARFIPNDSSCNNWQQVAKSFLRDRGSDGLSRSIRGASWDGDVSSIAAALDAGELVDDFAG